MEFLAILLVFVLERYRGWYPGRQHDDWLQSYSGFQQKLVQRLGAASWFHPLLVIALPALVLAWLAEVLEHVWFGLPEFLLAIGVLYYSTGRGNFRAAVDDYLGRWQAGDLQGAYHVALEYAPHAKIGEAEDPAQLHRYAVEVMLYRGFERWFAVVFWFALLGPGAALAYRLTCLYSQLPGDLVAANQARLGQFIRLVEWLPVRLLGFSFALAGNFASCYRMWREQFNVGGHTAPVLLRMCGIAALGEDEELACQQPCPEPERKAAIDQAIGQVRGLESLLQRSAVVWLVAMAVAIVFVDW